MLKRICLLGVIVCMTLLCVQPTVSYLTALTTETVNPFHPGNVTVTVEENFNGSIKTNVKVRNSGTADAFVRVKATAGWYTAEGSLAAVPVAGTYTCSTGSGWVLSGGYYYCTSPIAAGSATPVLFTSVQPDFDAIASDERYDGLYFHFDILTDAVQAEGTDDTTENAIVVEAWGVNPLSL